MAANLRKVRKIGQTHKDLVYGYMKRMQLMFADEESYFTIAQLIKDLCLLYSHPAISSKILTQKESIKLLKMVNHHRQIKSSNEWKLLFRGSRDGFRRKDFFDKCNKMDNTLCIIQTPQNNVFGGYTSLKWNREYGNYDSTHCFDSSAFIYKIRSKGTLDGQLFAANFGRDAIQYYNHGYLSFGNYGGGFFVHEPDQLNQTAKLYTLRYTHCPQYGLTKGQLNGTDAKDKFVPITEIEVFQIHN